MKMFFILCGLFMSMQLSALEQGESAISLNLDYQTTAGDMQNEDIIKIEDGKKYLLLEFMSITCKYCVANMPIIASLGQELSGQTTIKLVSIDRDVKKVKEFISDNQALINYSFFFDNQRLAKAQYGIIYVPTVYVIDELGTILLKHIGELSEEDVQKIKMILKQ